MFEKHLEEIKDYGQVAKNIRKNLKDYVVKNKLKSLVLGISGGIDSTATAMLARPVCDELKIPLIGRSLPIETNTTNEIKIADEIGHGLCTDFKEIDMGLLYDEMVKFIIGELKDPTNLEKLRCANFKVRLRMIKLYDIAQATGGMVLSTDNFTEFLTGFFTKHGDVGDYGMIQNLWKMEVYTLVNFLLKHDDFYITKIDDYVTRRNDLKFHINKSAEATPTDGLGISRSDVEQLGVPDYATADRLFKEYFAGDMPTLEVDDHPIIKRYFATDHKRNDPYNITRQQLLKP